MISNEIFQKIFDEISKFLPDGWEKVVTYFEYGKASYTFEFFVKVEGQYVKCYSLPNVSDDDLLSTFKSIDLILSPERDADKLWTTMTMIVTSDGNMHTDFDYTDLSEGSYKYKKNWKAKYLL